MFRLPFALFLFTILTLFSCNKSYVATKVAYERIEINRELGVHKEIFDIIQPYENELKASMTKVIANAPERLIKGKPESPLGNLIADIILEKASEYSELPVDFSIVNYGGIRLPYLTEGQITVGNIYELMPFDNLLYVLRIEGSVVQQMLDIAAGKGGWPIAGARFEIAQDKAVNIRINDELLDRQKVYTLAISDYLANGGDNLSMLIGVPRHELSVLFRDALIEYLEAAGNRGQPITAKVENRVRYAE